MAPTTRLVLDLRACPSCTSVEVCTRRVARAGAIRYSDGELYQAACVGCGTRGPEVASRIDAAAKWNAMAGRVAS